MEAKVDNFLAFQCIGESSWSTEWRCPLPSPIHCELLNTHASRSIHYPFQLVRVQNSSSPDECTKRTHNRSPLFRRPDAEGLKYVYQAFIKNLKLMRINQIIS